MTQAQRASTRLSALLLASLVPGAAVAHSEPPVTFAVDYLAAGDCPDRASFEAAIRTRWEQAQLAPPAEAQVTFKVTLEPAGSAKRSELRVRLRDGSSTVREVPDDACADAMQSMAVIAAMVLEAQATQPPAGTVEAEDARGAAEGQVALPTGTAQPPARVQPAPVAPGPATPRRRKALAGELLLALDGVVEGSVAPSPAPGVALGVELRQVGSRWLSFSGRLSAVFAQSFLVETDSGDARFQLLSARLDLCGLQARFARLSARACAELDGGVLRGQGLNALNQRAQSMPWLGLGLGARLELPVTDRLGLELLGGGRGLFVHDRFTFSPGTTIHEVPVFAWNFGAGLSLRL